MVRSGDLTFSVIINKELKIDDALGIDFEVTSGIFFIKNESLSFITEYGEVIKIGKLPRLDTQFFEDEKYHIITSLYISKKNEASLNATKNKFMGEIILKAITNYTTEVGIKLNYSYDAIYKNGYYFVENFLFNFIGGAELLQIGTTASPYARAVSINTHLPLINKSTISARHNKADPDANNLPKHTFTPQNNYNNDILPVKLHFKDRKNYTGGQWGGEGAIKGVNPSRPIITPTGDKLSDIFLKNRAYVGGFVMEPFAINGELKSLSGVSTPATKDGENGFNENAFYFSANEYNETEFFNEVFHNNRQIVFYPQSLEKNSDKIVSENYTGKINTFITFPKDASNE